MTLLVIKKNNYFLGMYHTLLGFYTSFGDGGNPVYVISIHSWCDRSVEDAYSSMAPDPTLLLSGARVTYLGHSFNYDYVW
jgi:hypothetical protein